jgi:hypothetical protein
MNQNSSQLPLCDIQMENIGIRRKE